ncbi:hypothetical protein [Opitutus sp. ER46]|uniref:hypothetical protein n=1 Tax=Opitutus sp. ER46 TaxID=2161864 RepID=UPI001E651C3E|nr:hypothetical protein [Opitutus sp. ER46]
MKRSARSEPRSNTAKRALIRKLIEQTAWASASQPEANEARLAHRHALHLLGQDPDGVGAPETNVIPFPGAESLKSTRQE